MKYLCCSLITGVSFIIIITVNNSLFAENTITKSTESAAIEVQEPNESSNSAAVNSDEYIKMQERLAYLEAAVETNSTDELQKQIKDIRKKYNTLEVKYLDLQEKQKKYSKNKKKDADKKDSTLYETSVMELLDEYYVDANLDLKDTIKQADETPVKNDNKTDNPENKTPADSTLNQNINSYELPVKNIKRNAADRSEDVIPAEPGLDQNRYSFEMPVKNIKKKEADKIVEYVNKSIVESSADNSENNMDQALRKLHKAQKLYYSGRYGSALKAVGKSLSQQKTAFGYALEGSILFTMGETGDAIESWDTALELDPGMHEVRDALDRYK